LATAVGIAERIGEGAPLSVRYSKAVMRSSAEAGAADAVQAHSALLAAVFASEDSREGGRAFGEKRRPVWSGR
jgi:enoyl-CoA hydratase/carnithine racemase